MPSPGPYLVSVYGKNVFSPMYVDAHRMRTVWVDDNKNARYARVTPEKAGAALQEALDKLDQNLSKYTGTFPADSTDVRNHFIYLPENSNTGSWTQSFFTGMTWLAYEMTGKEKYRQAAEAQVATFKNRMDEGQGISDHDLGFLYTLSCVADYKLTGNPEARETALRAADQLLLRYQPNGKFIQTSGNIGAEGSNFFIIDTYMNLPLLYWASNETQNSKYYDIAYNHHKTAVEHVIRDDGSTYQRYYYDPDTGLPLRGGTSQGAGEESCWSRGEAWGIYGLALTYEYTGDDEAKARFKKVADYFISHLPEDKVPYWDFDCMDRDKYNNPGLYDQYEGQDIRDSSAAAIAVCGLLEMAKRLPDRDPDKQRYTAWAHWILESLIDDYTYTQNTQTAPQTTEGILIHGTHSLPGNIGVDGSNLWGDYFYMEALVRVLKDWNIYW